MKTTRLLAAMLLAAGLLQVPAAHAVSAAVAKPLKEASDLVRAGKIGYVGVSNFSGWHLMKSLAAADRHERELGR